MPGDHGAKVIHGDPPGGPERMDMTEEVIADIL
jgi:hypothetical protein